MRYNYGDLERLFEEIKELLEYVKQNKLTYTNYYLYLANLPNGKNLEYELTKECIPHLLGINTTYLISTGLYSSKNSYYVLTEMLEDPYRVYNLAKEDKLNYNLLFSKYIEKKLSCFKSNININPHEVEAVSVYMPERTYGRTDVSHKFDYCIIKKYENGSIGLLCLAKNSDGIYVPMSNQILESESEIEEALSEKLSNQEITILTGIQSNNFHSHKIYITLPEQIERVNNLQAYKSKYNVSIDISNNYIYYINKLIGNKEFFSQSEETSKVVEQSQELERIRKKVDELTALKLELEKRVTILTEDNVALTTEVNESQEREKQILKILKKSEK